MLKTNEVETQVKPLFINPILNLSDPDTFKIYLERTLQKLVLVRGVIDPDTYENQESNNHTLYSVITVDNNPAEHYNLYPSAVVASGLDFDSAVDLINTFNPLEE
jgi:hypothetical protein